jgi:pimeloyl-ACP methyl ester carboxylesterase
MRMVNRERTTDPADTTRLTAADGVTLSCETRHPQGRPGVLFAHGFGQTRHAWTATAKALAASGCRCTSFDARGHGESGRPGDGYHMQQFFDDLRLVAAAEPQKPVLVGASMGGLLGLAVAGESDEPPFSALVLVDITPRWETSGVERILGFMRAWPAGFADYDEAAQAIAAYLPHRSRRKSESQLAPLLRRGRDGRLRWHWDPAMLEPIAEEGEQHQPRLIEAARRVELPVLLLSGGRSDVVSDATIDEFLDLVPHAEHRELPRATHMVAGDANDAFTRAIAEFIGVEANDDHARPANAGAT